MSNQTEWSEPWLDGDFMRDLERLVDREPRFPSIQTEPHPNPLVLDGEGKSVAVTRETIYNIARVQPAVYASLMAFRKGQLTWEEAMMTCVYLLNKHNRILSDDLIQSRAREVPAHWGK